MSKQIDFESLYRSLLASKTPEQLMVMEHNLKELLPLAAEEDEEIRKGVEDSLRDVQKMQRLYKTNRAV